MAAHFTLAIKSNILARYLFSLCGILYKTIIHLSVGEIGGYLTSLTPVNNCSLVYTRTVDSVVGMC